MPVLKVDESVLVRQIRLAGRRQIVKLATPPVLDALVCPPFVVGGDRDELACHRKALLDDLVDCFHDDGESDGAPGLRGRSFSTSTMYASSSCSTASCPMPSFTE